MTQEAGDGEAIFPVFYQAATNLLSVSHTR